MIEGECWVEAGGGRYSCPGPSPRPRPSPSPRTSPSRRQRRRWRGDLAEQSSNLSDSAGGAAAQSSPLFLRERGREGERERKGGMGEHTAHTARIAHCTHSTQHTAHSTQHTVPYLSLQTPLSHRQPQQILQTGIVLCSVREGGTRERREKRERRGIEEG